MNHTMNIGLKIAGMLGALLLVFSAVQVANAQSMTAHVSSQLDFGARGSDVTTLQTFLAEDATIYPSGLVTGYFGPLTRSGVTAFQVRVGLPAVGRVGPLTMAKINAMIDNGGLLGTGSVGTVTGDSAPIIFNIAISSSTMQNMATSTAVGSRMATVSWSTNVPTTGKVFYGPTPLVLNENMSQQSEPSIAGGFMGTDGTLSTTHSVQLSNMTAGTLYYYSLQARDAVGNVSLTWPTSFQISQ